MGAIRGVLRWAVDQAPWGWFREGREVDVHSSSCAHQILYPLPILNQPPKSPWSYTSTRNGRDLRRPIGDQMVYKEVNKKKKYDG